MNDDLDDIFEELDDDSEDLLDDELSEKIFNISARQRIDLLMEERRYLQELGEDLW